MILRQYLHSDPVAASYLVGCGGKRLGAVVDPVGDVERYLLDAADLGVAIRFVVDTHVHADHVSPGRRLAASADASYVLSATAEARFPLPRNSSG